MVRKSVGAAITTATPQVDSQRPRAHAKERLFDLFRWRWDDPQPRGRQTFSGLLTDTFDSLDSETWGF